MSRERTSKIVEKLKVLNILIVEDDEQVKTTLTTFFTGKCKKLHVASDGLEGLEILAQDPDINVIISDINMPKLSGLNMLSQIRESGKFKGEVIFLTAYSDSKNILEAIKLNISNYLTKPLDLKTLLMQLDKIGQSIIDKADIENKNKEIHEYVNMLNQVAIVSKTNLKGKITYANDIFCDISGYTQDELMGKPHNIVRHPDVPKEIFKNLWDTIKSGRTWRGKVKNLCKDKSSYYTDTTIYPIFDTITGDTKEYMSIRFLITEEENEKREFKKNVMNNIKENRRKDFVTRKKIDDLQALVKEKETEANRHKQAAEIEQNKIAKLNHQIDCYEDEIKKINNDFDLFKINTKNKMQEESNRTNEMKKKNDLLTAKIEELKQENEETKAQMVTLNDRHEENLKIIRDLRDVIEHS